MNVLKKQRRIQAIQAACRRLNIDTDERRIIQLQETGKASLTEMSLPELDDVLSHFNRISSGQPANEWAFVFKMIAERQPYAKKIFRLAERIGRLQQPPVPIMSKAYIEGVARQMRGGFDQPLEFCDVTQLLKIIAALDIFVKRHGG